MNSQSSDTLNLTEKFLNELSESKIAECKEFFDKEGVKQFLNDDELKNTINSLFQNNLNVCKTSKQTFMHRNTLLYRIDKVKKMTSLDARLFKDAVSLQTLLLLHKLYG